MSRTLSVRERTLEQREIERTQFREKHAEASRKLSALDVNDRRTRFLIIGRLRELARAEDWGEYLKLLKSLQLSRPPYWLLKA